MKPTIHATIIALFTLAFIACQKKSEPPVRPQTSAPNPTSRNDRVNPNTSLPRTSPVVSLWDGGVYLANIKPRILFAAWPDGTIVHEENRILNIGHTDPANVRQLLHTIEQAGFFTPPLSFGIAVADGPEIRLSVVRDGKESHLVYDGQTDFLEGGLGASPSKAQLEAFVQMWQKCASAIDLIAAKTGDLHPFNETISLTFPQSRSATE